MHFMPFPGPKNAQSRMFLLGFSSWTAIVTTDILMGCPVQCLGRLKGAADFAVVPSLINLCFAPGLVRGLRMGKRIYVGNLPWSMGNPEMEQLFSEFGTVKMAEVMQDRETGRSRGFGFVEMDSDESMHAAINGLNEKEVGGRPLVVNEAKPKAPSGGGGGRGGYGGGGGGGRGGYGGGGGRDRGGYR
jgi:hypothetical protein